MKGQRESSGSFDSEEMGASPQMSSPLTFPQYYVQSPASRDFSSEGDKPSMDFSYSANSTSVVSPIKNQSSYELEYANFPKPASQKIFPTASSYSGPQRKGYSRMWVPNESNIKEEEEWPENDDDESERSELSKYCLIAFIVLAIVGAFFLLFWLICRPPSPTLKVQDVHFQQFNAIRADGNGVPTGFVTANATVKIDFTNPSRYFANHAYSGQIVLKYKDLLIGENQIEDIHVRKKSTKKIAIQVGASKAVGYGAGAELADIQNGGGEVDLDLSLTMASTYNVIWRIISFRFTINAECNVALQTSSHGSLHLLQQNCTR